MYAPASIEAFWTAMHLPLPLPIITAGLVVNCASARCGRTSTVKVKTKQINLATNVSGSVPGSLVANLLDLFI